MSSQHHGGNHFSETSNKLYVLFYLAFDNEGHILIINHVWDDGAIVLSVLESGYCSGSQNVPRY